MSGGECGGGSGDFAVAEALMAIAISPLAPLATHCVCTLEVSPVLIIFTAEMCEGKYDSFILSFNGYKYHATKIMTRGIQDERCGPH